MRKISACHHAERNHLKGAKPIETTTDPPHRSPPINSPPIETTTDPPPIIQTTTDRNHHRSKERFETTTDRNHHRVSVFSVLRDRGRIKTHHRWKPTTKADDYSVPRFFCTSIPPSIDSSNLLSSTASPSIPLSFFKSFDVSLYSSVIFIDVTDPENKNGFYSGNAGSNEADQRRVTWKCLKLVLIASPGNVLLLKAFLAFILIDCV
ncbi:hypothetical protein HID58_085537, partial [Brassica napus]